MKISSRCIIKLRRKNEIKSKIKGNEKSLFLFISFCLIHCFYLFQLPLALILLYFYILLPLRHKQKSLSLDCCFYIVFSNNTMFKRELNMTQECISVWLCHYSHQNFNNINLPHIYIHIKLPIKMSQTHAVRRTIKQTQQDSC